MTSLLQSCRIGAQRIGGTRARAREAAVGKEIAGEEGMVIIGEEMQTTWVEGDDGTLAGRGEGAMGGEEGRN